MSKRCRGLIVWGMLVGVVVVFGTTGVMAQTGWFDGCKPVLSKYGQGSLSDSNEDGKLNMLDWAGCLPKGGVGGQGGVALLSASSIEGQAAPGELIIQLNDISQLENLRNAVEVESVQRLATLTMADLNLVKVLLKDETAEGTALAVNQMILSGNYKSMSPNWFGTLNATIPNDPKYGDQWNLNAIQAPNAWDLVKGTGNNSNILATVIDSGVKLDHPDLEGNLYGNWTEWQGGVASGAQPPDYYNGVNEDGNKDPQGNELADDVYGITALVPYLTTPEYDSGCTAAPNIMSHGTNVNGIIAAVGGNNQGISGINWRARLANVKTTSRYMVFGCKSSYDAVVNGIDYANFLKAPVANLSWGTDQSDVSQLETVTRRFTHNQNDQIKALLVAAAPNENRNYDDPANNTYPCKFNNGAIMCVTSTQLHNGAGSPERFDQEGYGANTVDLAAPGYEVITTTAWGQNYESVSGTSFAAPHVTGAVLLMMQANPDLTMSQIRDIIFATVDTKDDVPSFGLDFWPDHPEYALEGKVKTGGRLNLYKAVKCAQDLQCLNPSSASCCGSWSQGTEGGRERYEHTGVKYQGKIYYWGGTSGGITNSMDVYDIANDNWWQLPSGGTARQDHTAVVDNGKIYFWGGRDIRANFLASVDIYDIASNRWTQGTPGCTKRDGHTAVKYGGKIYYWGGRADYPNLFLNNGCIYDINQDAGINTNSHPWAQMTTGGTPRYNHTAVVDNGKIYFWGGNGRVDDQAAFLNTVDIYDINTHSWAQGTPGGIPRADHTAVKIGKLIYYYGGHGEFGVDGTVDIYDISKEGTAQNPWSSCHRVGIYRIGHTAIEHQGKIYYWGGIVNGDTLTANTPEIQDFATCGGYPTPTGTPTLIPTLPVTPTLTPTTEPCGAQCVPSNECYPLERRKSDEYCANNYVCCYPPPPTPTVPPGNYTWSGCASGSFSSPYCPPPAVVWGSACDQPGQTYYCYSGNCQDTGTADPCHGVQAPDGQVPIWGCTCQ